MSNTGEKSDYIDPKELIKRYSVEELNSFSDEYYKKLILPEFQLGKPFSMPMEAPQHLVRLGLILEELKLGPGTRVLDFGSGTGWISKALWQMGCDVIGTDVSEEAIRMATRLFEEYPIPMRKNGDWNLKLFNGHRLPLEDASVDKIVCYDTFHHVPNQETVINEFYRVLAEGGAIALNEPIGNHSHSEDSQREMRDYTVLENDLDIDELSDLFLQAGFHSPKLKVVPQAGFSLDLDQWKSMRSGGSEETLNQSITNFTQDAAIIIFQKGVPRRDSRHSEGLAHSITASQTKLNTRVDEPLWLDLKIKNTGQSIWLHGTGTITGIVNVGTQLVEPESNQLIGEHARFHLERDIYPGEEIEMRVPIIFREPGRFRLRLDLVSEIVCWFHQTGSSPIYLDAEVAN